MPDHEQYAEISTKISRLTKKRVLLRNCYLVICILFIANLVAGTVFLCLGDVRGSSMSQIGMAVLLLLKIADRLEDHYYLKITLAQREAIDKLREACSDADR